MVPLSRADILPALMGAGQCRDLLPHFDIVSQVIIGCSTTWGLTNQLIDFARPSSRCNRVIHNSFHVTDHICKSNLGILSQASTQPLINVLEGMSPIFLIEFWRFNIIMTFLPFLVSSDSSNCIQGDVNHDCHT